MNICRYNNDIIILIIDTLIFSIIPHMLLPRLKKHTYLVAAILRYSNSQNKRQPIVFMIQCSILNIVTLYYAVLNCGES